MKMHRIYLIYLLLILNTFYCNNPFSNNHNYYEAGPEFEARLYDNKNEGYCCPCSSGVACGYYICSIEAQFLNITEAPYNFISYGKYFYSFKELQSGDTFKIQIRNLNDTIKLETNTVYKIMHQILLGWPTTWGLVIKRDSVLIFEGITDWDIKGKIILYDSSTFVIQENRILNDNYLKNGECWNKITNSEIKFRNGTDSLYLHQGEMRMLGNYSVDLRVAREIEYNNNCYDAGMNEISFIIMSKE